MNSHALAKIEQRPELAFRLAKLVELSRERQTYSFSDLQWPESLPADEWWISPEMLSVYGTSFYEGLDDAQRMRLSQWECVNLFSLNVEGERELVTRLSATMYQSQLPGIESYMHHLIDEENKHMWFFGEFCRRYGGKIYSSKKASLAAEHYSAEMEYFLLFARIFLFEEVGSLFNKVAAEDERIAPFVREIHRIHHFDESRHLAFGRALLTQVKSIAFENSSPDEQASAVAHLQRYITILVEGLYQPAMYRDAGFPSGVALRREMLDSPLRRAHHRDVLLKRPLSFFAGLDIHLGEALA